MDFSKILSDGKKLVNEYDLSKYINVLLNYWEDYPPIPGHGFLHVLHVGVEAFNFAEKNDYESPQYLFIGGLFHDIYRPAEGKHGEEDQTYGSVIVKKLFQKNNLSDEIGDLIVGAINSHDGWRESDNPPSFDLYLSLGDKSTHNLLLTDSFVWITNKLMQDKGEEKVYTSHLETLSSFYRYQKRAWEIFMNYQKVIGIDRPIKAYMDIVKSTISSYEKDPRSLHFFEYIENQKEKCLEWEITYLKDFGRSNESIKKLTKLFH